MIAPMATERNEQHGVMRFFIPSIYTAATLPSPADEQVRIVTLPAQTLAALRLRGRLSDSAIAEGAARLLAALHDSAWRPAGKPGAFNSDPPGPPPDQQRNEVYVGVVATDPETRADG